MADMARLAGLEELTVPCKCGRQITWSNVSALTAIEHFERLTFISFLDCFSREFNSRFTTLTLQAVLALNIIPAHVEPLTIQTINSIYDRCGTDLDSKKTSFGQESIVWKAHWTRSKKNLEQIAETLHHPSLCIQVFQIVINVFQLYLLTSISVASVERFNLSLRIVKNRMRSSMGKDRFNELMLLYEQKDI